MLDKFNTLHKWFRGFIIPLLEKSIEALEKNGILALYISDYGNVNYVSKVKDFILKNSSMSWRGEMHWVHGKGIRKIYIWKKIEY